MDRPPGWDHNPSSWGHRLPLIGLAVVGCCIAGYLTLYQLRVIPGVWEPFFGDGSQRVLNSTLARSLPIPDAALGSLGYLVDATSGILGGERRWRTMPWVVFLFGFVAGSMAIVSIVLLILQPLAFHAWCSLCLCSVLISLGIVGPAIQEVLASTQHLRRSRTAGHSTWRAFWGLASDTAER